ncbi:MAG: hypothetical protein ABWY25_04075 [Paenisporosarcina sp.]|jgi:hypothetical protein
MTEPLEALYFNWLCVKVAYVTNPTPTLTYWKLLTCLHNTEFVWLLSGDDNRAADGIELRREFLLETDIPDHPEWRQLGCSVLEMFIGFSRRAEFMTDEPAKDWFWEFLNNLDLKDFNDAYNGDVEEIEGILDQFIWRTYSPDGRGGMFPLSNPNRDQKTNEIWYQFCDYLVDQDRLP